MSQPEQQPTATQQSPKIKHDWYQTETHIIVTVLVKNVQKDKVKINYGPNTLSVSFPIPGSESEYSLELDLLHSISPNECNHSPMSTKIEIKMKKILGLRWEFLERTTDLPDDDVKPIPQCVIDASSTKYPSSCTNKKDWDKLEFELKKQEAAEKPDGEDGLKSLFEQIYSQSSDEVRMAMNKSYSESGGTVLSTNWNEVSKDKVKIHPPDGMEYKNWDS